MGRSRSTERDTNGIVAALLRDLASVQTSRQSRWGYRRAAEAIRQLERPIEAYVQSDGTLRKIPQIGPSSTRVILEVLRTGRSETVERAIAASGRTADIETRRDPEQGFLTHVQAADALRDATLSGVTPSAYRGDLQMHSTWSDGAQTLDDIAKAGLGRGYEYCAVTDHSYGLPIARGMPMSAVVRQHQEIDRLNRKYRGRFRLLKGIEANIRADGSVDMAPEELRLFELVVAAPHSALRTGADQTARLIRAVGTPGVHILGHPRGRKYGVRPGVAADWDAVFDAARQADVAVEIDGDPSRQDIDHVLARKANGSGCLFALDSDAHAAEELEYVRIAIAHARLAGIQPERVVNTWPLEQLLAWCRRRQRASHKERPVSSR